MMSKNDSSSASSPSLLLVFPLWILAVISLGLLMFYAGTIFLWVISSFFLFVLLDSWIMNLRLRGVPTALATLIMVAVALILGTALISLMLHFSAVIFDDLEEAKKILLQYYDSFSVSVKAWFDNFAHSSSPLTSGLPVGKTIQKVEVIDGSPISVEWRTTLMHGLGSAVTLLTFALLIPILTFFMAAERDLMAEVFPRRFANKEKLRIIWKKIEVSTKGYFLGNLILGAVTFPLFVILFLIFNVKSAFTMAFLASIFNLVPFLGAILAGFLPFISLMAQNGGIGAGLILYALTAGVHFIVANFVTPKVLGAKVDLNATVSTVSLIVWGEMWGGLGLILAIPITAVIKILLENSSSETLIWIAALMSERRVATETVEEIKEETGS